MARLLAMEWDGHEARVVVARTSGGAVVVEQAFGVDLSPRGTSETAAEPNVGQRIASALSAHHVGRAETLVAVGRANIELRVLNVPPAPDDELPEIVRFQAMRQFTALGDDWALDYVPMGPGNEGGLSVLAAAISPELLQQIQKTSDEAGVSPHRLVLRPFAAASLLQRRAGGGVCQLMVDLLADEADLTVMAEQQVVFMRTVRLTGGGDEEKAHRALLAEIRRTMAAAQNQLGGRRVERIEICGDEDEHASLKGLVEQELSLTVELFNPFDGMELGPELASRLPDYPGRFAPLLGMLADEAAGRQHAIDFLHPRKKPPPPSKIRRNAFIGAAAAALIAAVVLFIFVRVISLERQISSLTKERDALQVTKEQADARVAEVTQIESWSKEEVNWLDELHELSQEFPPAEDAMLTRMRVSPQSGVSTMVLEGVAKESSTVFDIEKLINDERHVVKRGEGARPVDDAGPYRAFFNETITVRPAEAATKPPPQGTAAQPKTAAPASGPSEEARP